MKFAKAAAFNNKFLDSWSMDLVMKFRCEKDNKKNYGVSAW